MTADAFGPLLLAVIIASLAVAHIITRRANRPRVREFWATTAEALQPVLGRAFVYQCHVCELHVRQEHDDSQSFVLAVLTPFSFVCSRCASTLVALDFAPKRVSS